MKKIGIYALYSWDCPVCDATNTVESRDLKVVSCQRCSRKFEVEEYVGEVI
jgi:hypothetical protein